MKKSFLETRIEKLRKRMHTNEIDTILIFSDENRRYLSGFTGEDGNYDESAGLLIITQDTLHLATDSRYDGQASTEAPLFTITCYKEAMSKILPKILKSVNARNTAVETSRLTVEMHNKIKEKIAEETPDIILLSAEEILKDLRVQKDENEIKAIKTSLEIAEKSFLTLKGEIREGMSEKEAAWRLESLMRENGADALSFPVIAASGPNSALPHAIPGERCFQNHEPLLFDFGARRNGYCSDTTRTLILKAPDDTFKAVYNILFQAQKMAIDAIKPGVKCSEIDTIAREFIDGTQFKGTFGHSLGHGVGIAIHEAPRLSRFDESLLKEGMVVTVEPGIYLPQWGGIRLENMVHVTEDGSEVLNKLNYEDHIINN